MILAARALLSSVTRLLILADLVDIHLLLRSLRVVISAGVFALFNIFIFDDEKISNFIIPLKDFAHKFIEKLNNSRKYFYDN